MLFSCFIYCQFVASDVTTNQFIETSLNDDFEIKLKANHTTAYNWYWVNKLENANVDSIGFNYTSNNTGKKNLVGGGGVETWIFKATKIGLDSIVFHHKASFNSLEFQRKVFYINVKK